MLRTKINSQIKLLNGAFGLFSVSNTLPLRYNVPKYLDITTKCNSNFSLLNKVKKHNPAFPCFISPKKRFSTNKDQSNQETKNEDPQENKNPKRRWITWKRVAGFTAGVVIISVIFKDAIFRALLRKWIKYVEEDFNIRKKLSEDKGDPKGLVGILTWTGMAYFGLGNYTEANRYLEEAIELNKRLKPEENETAFGLSYAILEFMGETQFSRKKFDDALRYYERAYEMGQKKNNLEHSILCENIGKCHEQLQNDEEAVKYYKEAYEIKKQLSVATLNPELEKSAMLVIKALTQAGHLVEADAYQNEINQVANKLKE
jgi:tetratricopeptide (TPR) repeat protein